jgi:hypothetical protein
MGWSVYWNVLRTVDAVAAVVVVWVLGCSMRMHAA